jgi:hypothetical protein
MYPICVIYDKYKLYPLCIVVIVLRSFVVVGCFGIQHEHDDYGTTAAS